MSTNARLTILGEILVSFASSPLPSHLFQTLADYAPLVLEADLLLLCLRDADEAHYWPHRLSNRHAELVAQRPFPLTAGEIGQGISSARKWRGRLVESSGELEATLAAAGLTEWLVLPVTQGMEGIGALVCARAERPFAEEDEQVGVMLAAGLSANLQMSRLYQELADERSLLTAVIGNTQDGILVVNTEGVVLLANPAFGALFGVDVAALVGRPFASALSLPALAQLGLPLGAERVELRLPNERHVELSQVDVTSDYGEEIGWALIVHDVSSHKEILRLKDEFIGMVSHDLKNPIGGILMGAELMEEYGELTPSQQEMGDRIIQTGRYMLSLVNDMLEINRLETANALQVSAFDLTLLIEDVWLALNLEAEQKRQTVTLDLPPVCEIEGDRARLQQVLRNIIGNAIKYTPEAGQVEIRLVEQSEQVQLSVTDSGYGIPEESLPKIFDKFYRARSEAVKDIKGTGLGLAITKGVVEQHGGTIRVSSQLGAGSTFTVDLPRRQVQLPIAAD